MAGGTATEAAAAAGVNRRTLFCWNRDDCTFIAALNLARADLAAATRASMRALAGAAVGAVRELLTDQGTPPAVRLAAATKVLNIVGATEPDGGTPYYSTDPGWLRAHREREEAAWQNYGEFFLRGRPSSLTSPDWGPSTGEPLPYPLDPAKQPPPQATDDGLAGALKALLGRNGSEGSQGHVGGGPC
jgi:hypothetical protein